jgi:hypothetical protein
MVCLGEILRNKNIFTYIILFIAVRPVICSGTSKVSCKHGIKSAQQRELAIGYLHGLAHLHINTPLEDFKAKSKISFEISLRDKTFKTLLLTKISGRQYSGKLPIHIVRLKLCT